MNEKELTIKLKLIGKFLDQVLSIGLNEKDDVSFCLLVLTNDKNIPISMLSNLPKISTIEGLSELVDKIKEHSTSTSSSELYATKVH